MKFRTAYDTSLAKPNICGSKFKTEYTRKADDPSEIMESGKTNIADYIKKASVGVTLPDLIKRYTAGDVSAIPDMVDSFVDLTDAPRDMLDAHMKLESARLSYDALSAEVKQRFNNSFDNFVKSFGDGSLSDKLAKKPENSNEQIVFTADEVTKVRKLINGGTENA